MSEEILDLILDHLTVFRFILFLCTCFWAIILYYWMKPGSLEFKAGIMAAIVQFWIGILADYQACELGFWQYRSMGFMGLNVPLDLHLNWSLIWGLGICWICDKWPGKSLSFLSFLLYISAWTGLTLSFDMAVARWMIFLDGYSANWWMADIVILFVVQGLTLWFYKSACKTSREKCGLTFLPVISPYVRSLVYLSFFMAMFFLYIPERIEFLIQYFNIQVQTLAFPKNRPCCLFTLPWNWRMGRP